MGTTIKKAGYVKAAFRMVDHDSVVAFAEAAKQRGVPVFVHVTSIGADPHSRTFYSAVKGEAERSVAKLGIESVYALRPSILDGHRTEARPAERIGLAAARILSAILGKYRPTPVVAVARTMLRVASSPLPGVHVVEADAIG